MPSHFHLREELVMPPQQVFLKFRGEVHVHDFLYDVVDQDAMFEAMKEDERLLYGERAMIDDSGVYPQYEDFWEDDYDYPEEHYSIDALLGEDRVI